MKKVFLICAALFACTPLLQAQGPKVSLSAPFEEPETGWNKVMQLKNGNTFYFHFTRKDGIEVTVYDKSRKEISNKTLTSELWNPRAMRESVVEGVYEINGEPVLFFQQLLDKTPMLFRLRLDPNTGAMLKEKQIGDMERYKAGSGWAMAFGKVEMSDVYVEKDPASDCYAVAYFNSFAHDAGKRVEVIHYSGEHKILSRSYYFDSTSESPFKYVNFIGMTVQGDRQVTVCTYGFNTANSGGKDSRVIISKLRPNDKGFTHNMLDFTDDFRDTKAVMHYNPGTNMIQLLTLTYIKTKSKFWKSNSTNEFMTLISYIDPENLTVAFTKPILTEKVSDYAFRHFGTNSAYAGMPQNMLINQDHSTTLLLEEMTTLTTRNQYGQTIRVQTYLGNIGISELNDRGMETSGYALPKKQEATGDIPALYISKKSQGFWSYRSALMGGGSVLSGGGGRNNAFLSYDYVDAGKDRYVIFNDYPGNLSREGSKRKIVSAISDANTVCFKIKDSEAQQILPFGNPPSGHESNFSYIESSHFLPETKTYATLMIQRDGRKKEAHIAWLTF